MRALRVDESIVVEARHFGRLLEAIVQQGFEPIGPVVRDGAIVCDHLNSAEDLPAGWTDEQDAGTYRLKQRADGALFGFTTGPNAWKQFLHPPVERIWRARREGRAFRIMAEQPPSRRYAFIGVRACDLHAIQTLDRVFLNGPHVDSGYKSLREKLFLIGVNCGTAGGSCFCDD